MIRKQCIHPNRDGYRPLPAKPKLMRVPPYRFMAEAGKKLKTGPKCFESGNGATQFFCKAVVPTLATSFVARLP